MGYYLDEPLVYTVSLVSLLRPMSKCQPLTLKLNELVAISACPAASGGAAGKEGVDDAAMPGLVEANSSEMQAVGAEAQAGNEKQAERTGKGNRVPTHTCPRPRKRCSKRRLQEGADDVMWPRDGSVSMYNTDHVKMGWWAFDTINPNCWKGAATFAENTSADFVAVQETESGGLRNR